MSYTLLVMGNPLLDILVDAKDDSLLKKYALQANDAILAEEKHKPLYEELVADHDVKYVAGGAGQNTARGVQHILSPRSTVYIGCVGADDFSVQQKKSAEADGVRTEYLVDKEHATGKCAVVCFAAQRSLVADLSAANHYKISHLESEPIWKLVENAQYYYIASFFLTVSPPSLLKVADHACTANKVFCMNLSAPFLCQFFKEPMDQALPYVDILFGNESEAEAYSESHNLGTKDIKDIAMNLYRLPKKNQKRSRIVVLTQGPNSTIVVQDGKITEFPTPQIPKEEIVDTNGAGDSMAAGFLGHFIKGDSVAECVSAGHQLAGAVIRTSGCVYPQKTF